MAKLKDKIIARYGPELGEQIFNVIKEGKEEKLSTAEIKARAIKVIEPSLPENKAKEIADLVVTRQWISLGRHG
jgi:hypothetical protein